jgi:hypothetical protein
MQVTINIQAPELAKAIETLAAALSGGKLIGVDIANDFVGAPGVVTMPENFYAVPNTQVQQAPMQQAPLQQAPMQQAPLQQAPMQQAPPQLQVMPTYQPGAGQQIAPPPTVPTTAPSYTMEQLAVAATQLMDAGKRNELVQLLQSFGAPALTALPKEQYGEFATQLRGMGAKI